MAIVNTDLLRLITAERDKLNNMIERIQAGYDLRPTETIEVPTPASELKSQDLTPTGRKRRKLSAIAKQHMREAQQKRWGAKTTSVSSAAHKTGPGFRNGKHWTQTPEGRRRMALISRKGNNANRALRAGK